MAEMCLEKNQSENGGPVTLADSLTGADGIKRKTATLDVYPQYGSLEDSATIQVTNLLNANVGIILLKTQILTSTYC